MLRLHAEYFAHACFLVEGCSFKILRLPEWKSLVEHDLKLVKQECTRVGFSYLAFQTQSIIDVICMQVEPDSDDDKKKTVMVLLVELKKGIVFKLKSCMFFRVHTDRQKFYSDDDLPAFGIEVAKSFPKSTYHIAEARRCFALERWDACVHHLMLATEEALRQWARNLKMRPTKPLVLSNWETIFQNAHLHLKALRNEKKTINLDRKIKRLAETLSHFELIRDAWRNHSEHGREKYDERRAAHILYHVEFFMQSLARKRSVALKS